MSRSPPRFLLALLLIGLGLPAAIAQPTPADTTAAAPLVQLVLADGTVLVGSVLREDADEVVFRTTGGAVVTVPAAQVLRRSSFEGVVDGGQAVRFDPNRSRLLFAPTARAVGAGRGYFAVYELLLPFVAYGAGDAVTLAGGVSLVPGSSVQLAYFAPKVTIVDDGRLALGLGGIVTAPIGALEPGDIGAVGLLFGLGTLGTPRSAVTGGVGFGFSLGDGGANLTGHPVLMLGGETQVGPRVKLISENYVITYQGEDDVVCPVGGPCTTEPGGTEALVLLSGGVRFFGERLAADFALFTSPEFVGEGFPFFPWLGFSYAFGD